MEITKREIAVSVAILCVMVFLGFLIHSAIQNSIMEDNELYYTALKIDDDAAMFEWAIRTGAGRALVWGEFSAVEVIGNDEVGDVLFFRKIKERYTMHTRIETYTTTDSKGNTQTHTRTVVDYSWDHCGTQASNPSKVMFLDQIFDFNRFAFPSRSSGYFGQTRASVGNIRWHYEYMPTEFHARIAPKLRGDQTMTTFYDGEKIDVDERTNIEDFISGLDARFTRSAVLFWIAWTILTGGVIFGFYYIDNRWLED